MMKFFTYRVIIEPDENNTFHAYVPTLPGCHTFGSSIEETKKYIKEAIELYVEELLARNQPVPEENSLDTFETVVIPNAV
ncbi:MAG: type II toxin-antitoxin system HicB family antitoxin [Candidatus Magasanikbacteria bacterium]|nr:type II toxin-antitoxin system HicB family antitoxin [Candidatus Magasanikbacteria bacterium]